MSPGNTRSRASWLNEKPEQILRDAERQEAAHERREALDRPHPILCRCGACLAEEYGYEPSIEPDPSLLDEDGAA